ncbi:MAG: ribbon-helix-helix domain-containing protein [Thermoproteota archaeon]
MSRKRKGGTTVWFPQDMLEQILKLIREGKGGYVGPAEFVRDTVRRRLEELSKSPLDR